MTTHIIRAARDRTSFTVERSTAQDEKLSLAARGLLNYFLSQKDDWAIQPKELKQGIGINKVYALIAELIAAGYITKSLKTGTAGRFNGVEYLVYDSPFHENSETVEKSISPRHGIRETVEVPSVSSQSGSAPFHENRVTDARETVEKHIYINTDSNKDKESIFIESDSTRELKSQVDDLSRKFEKALSRIAELEAEAKRKDNLIAEASKKSPKSKEPLPWSALTLAMHNGIPEKIRPVRAAYHKHNTDAKALFQAGITAEQVSDFVQWKYATDHWMWTGSNNSPVMITMSMVAQNINASSEKVRDWVLKGRVFRAENAPPPGGKSKEPRWEYIPNPDVPGLGRRVPVWDEE